jgi:site-specific DNA-methyltransferase (adenine-specific)
MNFILYHGDCLEQLKRLEDNSVDSVVSDPPYGLSFMGKKWDYDVPSVEVWAECLRVLKPGGHLLAFAGTRTQHRMAVRIEDAGFEIRDMIFWCYGQGFPKSKNLGNGFGSALKPATEPITMARKPLDGTLEANFANHGTGGLNIDGCRVGDTVETWPASRSFRAGISSGYTEGIDKGAIQSTGQAPAGRWPANLIHDGSDEVVGLFPVTTSGGGDKRGGCDFFMGGDKRTTPTNHTPNTGSAARFFYCAKASKRDRDEGLEGFEVKTANSNLNTKNGAGERLDGMPTAKRANVHPTVKPTDLMRYLCRLVTPPGGIVLDPFMGSGSTGKAAVLEGFQFIGIERELEYVEIAKARIEAAKPEAEEPPQPGLFD